MDRNHTLQASLLVALSGILYGLMGYLGTRILQENFSIPAMLFWRFFIAGGWMCLFLLHKYSVGKKININRRALLYMFFLGAIGYAGSSGFYFIASQYTGTGLAMVIFFSYPILVALASWLIHRHRFNIATGLVLITMMVGLYLLRNSSAAHTVNLLGILFGLLAAASYAIYIVGSKRFSSLTINSNVLTITVCFSCAFIYLASSLITHSFMFPHSLKSYLYIFALGIFATAIPIQLMLEGLKHISSMRASIISVLEPLVTVFMGMLMLGESVSHIQMLGAFIILGSAILIQFQREL